MNQYLFFKSALAHYITGLGVRWVMSPFRVVVVLGIIALPYILPLPFFNSLAQSLGQSYISAIGYQIELTHPSPASDYILSQSPADYKNYVLIYKDLHMSYQTDPIDLTISDWGRAHYIEYGDAEDRFIPVRETETVVVRKRTQPSGSTSSIRFRVHSDPGTIRIDNDSDQQQIGFGQICFSAFFNSLCWEQDQNNSNARENSLANQNFGFRIKNAYSLNDLSPPITNEQSNLLFIRQGSDPYLTLSNEVIRKSKGHLLQRVSNSLLLILWPIAILFITTSIMFFYKNILRHRLINKEYKSLVCHIPIFILVVFCIAVGVRGIDYGDHFDEGGYIDTTKQMLEQVGSGGSLLPHWYGFPSLIFYLGLLPIAPEAILKQITESQRISSQSGSVLSTIADQRISVRGLKRYQYILKTRYISLFCYGASIILIYLIILKMSGNWREAFPASAFFGLSWEALYHFRMFTPDPIMVPFILLALYFLVLARDANNWDRYLRYASVCAGIACGAKYTAIFLTLSIGLASLYLHLRSKHQIYVQQTQEAAFVSSNYGNIQVHSELGVRSFLALGFRLVSWFLLAYFLTTPGTLLEPVKFISDVTTQEWIYREAGGGGYSVWLLFDKLQISSTYLGGVFFSHFLWISIILSIFFLFGLYQITRETYIAILCFPYLFALLLILLSYNIIYLRNFLSVFPFLAVIAARGYISSHTWVLSFISSSSKRLIQLITGIYILFFVLIVSLNSYWIWISTESIQLAQPTNYDRMVCEETYKLERPKLSSCNAYSNQEFADKQISQLIDHISKAPESSFVLSNMVRTELRSRNIPTPLNVVSSYDVKALAVFYSREPFVQPMGTPWYKVVDSTHLDSMGANRFNHYQLLPSGPYDVNFTYYPTWPGPNRIVMAPLKETFEEAGAIFSLKD